MQSDLRNLIDKYKEMTKKIGTSSSMDSLLNGMDLLYDSVVMTFPLPLAQGPINRIVQWVKKHYCTIESYLPGSTRICPTSMLK